MAYATTTASLRLFGRMFVSLFCTKLVSYACGITSFVLKGTTYFVSFIAYAYASRWTNKRKWEDIDGRQVPYFQGGGANVQLEFVQRKWRVFLFVFTAAALCTMGQIHAASSISPSSFEPETISNVFCKADNKRQLECRVNVAYHNPVSESKVENCFCNLADNEWDFCGA